MWSSKGHLSLKPLSSWNVDLKERISFLNNWIKNGVPNTFWISGIIKKCGTSCARIPPLTHYKKACV